MSPTKRLLVLDDDPAVARTVEFIARGEGADVMITSGPQEFFERIADWAPTCLLLDLVMPTMDGMEVLRSLAERECKVAIVVMSGMGAKVLESAQRSALARGLRVRGILPKPFKPAALRALLQDSEGAADVRPPRLPPRDEREPFTQEEISAALAHDEFFLYYQPEIELASGRALGFEALLRWRHPQHGTIRPARFIELVENSALINALTRRVIDLGFAWFARMDRGDGLKLSINLSAANLDDVNLADSIHERCLAFGLAASEIVLELTETSAMRNPANAYETLTRLRIKGFGLSIDDFGTGYSSMVQLARLPFSWIKIDRSFVMSMTDNPESRKIVEAIIKLGKSLGLTTVAEGVESEEALQTLQQFGCHAAQGFHIARPLNAMAAQLWLAQRRAVSAAARRARGSA